MRAISCCTFAWRERAPQIRSELRPSGKNGHVVTEISRPWTITEPFQLVSSRFVACYLPGTAPKSISTGSTCIGRWLSCFKLTAAQVPVRRQRVPQCPKCTASRYPRIDRAGSSATLTGGVFGRVDATYISVEAQKSTGSLHAHCQVFVQCMHQHTPLTEIFQLVEDRLDALVESLMLWPWMTLCAGCCMEAQEPGSHTP